MAIKLYLEPVDNDRYDRKLVEIINRHPAGNLLLIPGVYELVSDDVGNDVMAELKNEEEGEDA